MFSIPLWTALGRLQCSTGKTISHEDMHVMIANPGDTQTHTQRLLGSGQFLGF